MQPAACCGWQPVAARGGRHKRRIAASLHSYVTAQPSSLTASRVDPCLFQNEHSLREAGVRARGEVVTKPDNTPAVTPFTSIFVWSAAQPGLEFVGTRGFPFLQ